jgi:hypothetical protein
MEDIEPKVRRIIQEDTVIAKTSGAAVKMGLTGRDFSCCIHSDLPCKFFVLLYF